MKYLFLFLFLISTSIAGNSSGNAEKIIDKYLVEEWTGAQATIDASGSRIIRPVIHYWLKTSGGDKEVGKGEWEKIILN